MIGRAAWRVVVVVVGLSLLASEASAWELIAKRQVTDRVDHDLIAIEGERRFTRIKLCAHRHPVKVHALELTFSNGDQQNVRVRAPLSAGACTGAIDLNGVTRDIATIKLVYEEASVRKSRTVVRVLAE